MTKQTDYNNKIKQAYTTEEFKTALNIISDMEFITHENSGELRQAIETIAYNKIMDDVK